MLGTSQHHYSIVPNLPTSWPLELKSQKSVACTVCPHMPVVHKKKKQLLYVKTLYCVLQGELLKPKFNERPYHWWHSSKINENKRNKLQKEKGWKVKGAWALNIRELMPWQSSRDTWINSIHHWEVICWHNVYNPHIQVPLFQDQGPQNH